ncbi:MAG: epoxide hydrolase family protein, partial [Acidimicrobiales bacterium]
MAQPFSISVSDETLADLRRRLQNTRWPEKEPVDDWSQGVPLAYVQEVCDYWAGDYDWRRREAALNRFDQFTTSIDDLDIHYIHVRSPEPNAFPLLITHGWPGSTVEFHKVIEPLTNPAAHGGDPADAFDVICPSLPGYGFSGKPTTTGWGVAKVAETWVELMARLGYERYGAQGGDWGAAVTTAIGGIDPAHCAGIHLNMPLGRPGPDDTPETDAETRVVAAIAHYQDWDSGYSKQQSTRPQTLGYGLSDSPAGQAAWILEKFWAWTDCDGHPENVLSRDEMLDNIMFYWLNTAATSSARLYWESFGKFRPSPVTIPTGVAAFPK